MTVPCAGPRVELRRSGERFVTMGRGSASWHSFSFGRHYDPANVRHGPLLASNEETLLPGAGFEPHRHRDVEIVTWVLEGSLAHRDATGRSGVVRPGLVQRMSAGRGVVHSERNDSAEPVRFVQMWVQPDDADGEPGYEQRDVSAELAGGGLVPVATGTQAYAGPSALTIGNRGATLHVARLDDEAAVALPRAAYVHLFVARGDVAFERLGALTAGDAVRLTASGGQTLRALGPAEVLVWSMGPVTEG